MKYLLLLSMLGFAACATAEANPYLIIEKRCVTIYSGESMLKFKQLKAVSAKKSKDGYWVFKLKDGKVTSFDKGIGNSILIEDITECTGRR